MCRHDNDARGKANSTALSLEAFLYCHLGSQKNASNFSIPISLAVHCNRLEDVQNNSNSGIPETGKSNDRIDPS